MNLIFKPSLGKRSAAKYIGTTSYEVTFGTKFIDEDHLDDCRDVKGHERIILSDFRFGLPAQLHGKRVAIVGNGLVKNCGAEIDDHDVIIRITGMRHWARDADNDGVKTTMWTGHPCFVVYRSPLDKIIVNDNFSQLVNEGVHLWALSPFHISLDSYNYLKSSGRIDDLLVSPPPAVIYDIACSELSNQALAHLFHIPMDRGSLHGLPVYDLLLTGTRLAFLLSLVGVSDLSIYGCDMFRSETEKLWEGHCIKDDIRVMHVIKHRIQDRGGKFYWHEESRIARQ